MLSAQSSPNPAAPAPRPAVTSSTGLLSGEPSTDGSEPVPEPKAQMAVVDRATEAVMERQRFAIDEVGEDDDDDNDVGEGEDDDDVMDEVGRGDGHSPLSWRQALTHVSRPGLAGRSLSQGERRRRHGPHRQGQGGCRGAPPGRADEGVLGHRVCRRALFARPDSERTACNTKLAARRPRSLPCLIDGTSCACCHLPSLLYLSLPSSHDIICMRIPSGLIS